MEDSSSPTVDRENGSTVVYVFIIKCPVILQDSSLSFDIGEQLIGQLRHQVDQLSEAAGGDNVPASDNEVIMLADADRALLSLHSTALMEMCDTCRGVIVRLPRSVARPPHLLQP